MAFSRRDSAVRHGAPRPRERRRSERERDAHADHRRRVEPAHLQPEGERAGEQADAERGVQPDVVVVVEEDPGADEPLCVDPRPTDAQPPVDHGAEAGGIAEPERAEAGADGDVAREARVGGERELEGAALRVYEPVRAEPERRRGGSGTGGCEERKGGSGERGAEHRDLLGRDDREPTTFRAARSGGNSGDTLAESCAGFYARARPEVFRSE